MGPGTSGRRSILIGRETRVVVRMLPTTGSMPRRRSGRFSRIIRADEAGVACASNGNGSPPREPFPIFPGERSALRELIVQDGDDRATTGFADEDRCVRSVG